ncbi:hypothetical protein [Pseudoroseicyclus sp. CXY001]|uniref:hypothetical protein n=1 Tax=Pseudoroseicyclus sp. CXY001 TaxID=3242492 RepID=UPI00358DBCCA
MTRRVILHLGMHKTGTTTLQNRLDGFDDGRTRYLDLGYPNHSIPLKLAYLEKAPRHFYESDDKADWPAERAAALARIERALEEAAPKDVVISGEELSTFPGGNWRPQMVSHLKRRVGRVEAIGYVRDPGGFMASDFGQRVQAGFREFDIARLYPRYRFRFQGWLNVMREAGAPADLSLFDPATYEEGDVVNDFVRRAGLDPAALKPKTGLSNPSLTAEGAAVFYAFRHADGPNPIRGAENQAQNRLVNLMYGFGRNPIRLSPEILVPVFEENAGEIAWIEKVIGQRFPAPKEGPVMFESSDQIVRYAASIGPELAEWLHAQGFEPANSGRDVPAIMRGMVLSLMGTSNTVANRLRYRLAIWRRGREEKALARAERREREAAAKAAAAEKAEKAAKS